MNIGFYLATVPLGSYLVFCILKGFVLGLWTAMRADLCPVQTVQTVEPEAAAPAPRPRFRVVGYDD